MHVLDRCYGISNECTLFNKGVTRLVLAGNYCRTFKLPELDTEFRKTALRLPGNDNFSCLLGQLALRYLPVCRCEALPDLLEAARDISLPHRGAIVTSVGCFIDPLFTTLAVISRKPIAMVEHGGGQMYRHFPSYDYGRNFADRYYDWGTSSPYFLPIPYISMKYQRNELRAPLLVCGTSWRFPFMLHSESSIDSREYFANRMTFLRHIEPCKRPEIRLYIREYGWAERKPLDDAIPGLSYQSAAYIPIEQAMADALMVVLDCYSTTFHRALATNTPTIIFAQPGLYSVYGEATIGVLRKCSIWHDTPESAATFYMELIGKAPTWEAGEKNVLDWWNGRAVRKAREVFCKGYAYTDSNWPEMWQNAFDALC